MRFLVMVLIPFVAYAQITMKTGSFQFDAFVDLTTGEYSIVEVPSERIHSEYHCMIDPEKRDLFLNAYYFATTDICPNPASAIGSERPFYRFEKELDSTDLDVVLNLKNTTFCTKIDTNYDNPTGISCELPYFISTEKFEKIILVVTTSKNKYALVILTPTSKTVDCYSAVDNPITGEHTSYHWTLSQLTGFNATWYIQENGSPLFKGIDLTTGVVHNPYRRYSSTASHRAGYYSLLGQKVPMKVVRCRAIHHGTPSLYVVEDRGDTRLMLK